MELRLLFAGNLPRLPRRPKQVQNAKARPCFELLCAISIHIRISIYPPNLYSRFTRTYTDTSINMRFSTIAAFATSLAVVSAQTPDLSSVPNCAVCFVIANNTMLAY